MLLDVAKPPQLQVENRDDAECYRSLVAQARAATSLCLLVLYGGSAGLTRDVASLKHF